MLSVLDTATHLRRIVWSREPILSARERASTSMEDLPRFRNLFLANKPRKKSPLDGKKDVLASQSCSEISVPGNPSLEWLRAKLRT